MIFSVFFPTFFFLKSDSSRRSSFKHNGRKICDASIIFWNEWKNTLDAAIRKLSYHLLPSPPRIAMLLVVVLLLDNKSNSIFCTAVHHWQLGMSSFYILPIEMNCKHKSHKQGENTVKKMVLPFDDTKMWAKQITSGGGWLTISKAGKLKSKK